MLPFIAVLPLLTTIVLPTRCTCRNIKTLILDEADEMLNKG